MGLEEYNAEDFRREIARIKLSLDHGLLSYDEAQREAQPILDEMNKRAEKVAKKYNKKPSKFSFIGLMR